MAPKRNASRVDVSIDYTCNDLRSWYFDIYGLEGAQFHKVHLFISKQENESHFEDVGQIVEASISTVDGHPEVECIDILVPMNQEFQLSPGAYAFSRMSRDKEETMFSRGWKIKEPTPDITDDQLQSSIIATLKGKKVKASQPPAKKQAKVQKVAPMKTGSILDVDNASLLALSKQGSMSKMRIVDPEVLEAKAKKGTKKIQME